MSKDNLAIIPARGGSKRIPRKNLRDFLGRPVISYAIENAIKTGLFEEIIVSTDDSEIAAVAQDYGARVPFFRSAETSGDMATTAEVLLEVLGKYRESGTEFIHACCIYPTAVFASPGLLKRAYGMMTTTNANSIFSLVQYAHPIWRAYRLKDEVAGMIWPGNKYTRTQDMEKTYHDAGQFYWFKIDSFLKTHDLTDSTSGAIVLNENEVQDIDDETDWKVAEMKYKLLNG